MNPMSRLSPRNAALAAICALAWSPCALAQTSPPPEEELERALARIRPQAIQAHMRFLADDLLEGRGTGSRGYDLAAKYVASRFEALGLEPAGEHGGYFQTVPLRRTETIGSECSLALLRDGKRTELRYGEDYLFEAYTPAGAEASVTAPLVFAGFGVTAPELGYDDYAGLDVRGKIVVRLSGAPRSFPNDQRAYHSDLFVKRETEAARGALAVLVILSPDDERQFSWESLALYTGRPAFQWVDADGKPARVPAAVQEAGLLSRKGAEALFAGASHSLAEVLAAADSGRPPSFELPGAASLRTVSRHGRAASPNVAAVLRGSDPRLRDEYVVLSAHLDHLGVDEPVAGDAIYNGAYDNASGVAALLEAAHAFAGLSAPPRRSILFLAVTAEEHWLQGSDYFAHHPTVPIEKIVANINIDMFLTLYPLRDVIAYGAEHSSLGQSVREAAHRLGLDVSPDPYPEAVMFIRSDQYSFIQQGVPSLALTNGVQSDDPARAGALVEEWVLTRYHKPGDDMGQTFDFESGAQFARLNVLLAWRVAQDGPAPRWNPGDFFGETFGRKPEAAGIGSR
jgi:Zn-dependent M28 family amino/carboxypeptidase